MQKLIVEAIGTFFLVLTVGLTAGRTDFAPLAIGASLMIMVYAGGFISGANYNPAVSLGLLLRKKLSAGDALGYMLVQFVAGTAAALTAQYLVGPSYGAPSPAADATSIQALVTETLFTFALVWVVLTTATAKGTQGNSFYGLAIGFTVVVGAFAGGGISGGAYNPAVGLGPNLIKGNLAPIWLYLAGPFLGGALAAVTFGLASPADSESQPN